MHNVTGNRTLDDLKTKLFLKKSVRSLYYQSTCTVLAKRGTVGK